jgi:hypothetical protein
LVVVIKATIILVADNYTFYVYKFSFYWLLTILWHPVKLFEIMAYPQICKKEFQRGVINYWITKMVIVFGPCAPNTNDCSISAVFEGPAIKTPKSYWVSPIKL